MTTVLVGAHHRLVEWCARQQVNPRGRDVVFVSTHRDALHRLRGRHFGPDDQVVHLHGLSDREQCLVDEELRHQGLAI